MIPTSPNYGNLTINHLGPRLHPSPALKRGYSPDGTAWHSDGDRILLNDHVSAVMHAVQFNLPLKSIELAGPRREIYFNPEVSTCAIVTCGGLCPGLNDVIRSIVMQAWYAYGTRKIIGIPFGFEGLNPDYGHKPIELTPHTVSTIHYFGGTMLGSSRGRQDTTIMADYIEKLGVNMLFVIGGVPKTIDNDLLYMDRSFGYQTAFTAAFQAVISAHTEAAGARNGLGIVKLMGRDSGFIACSAALATGETNFVLIPEVPFQLEGENGLFALVKKRLSERGHAVIVVAEGAGQDLLATAELGVDASGNQRYGDIGVFLKDQFNAHFKQLNIELNAKYIDPSYIIRSVPAAPEDRVFCYNLGRHAVHAAMAGKTGMVIARWHQRFVHLPVDLVTAGRRKVDSQGDLWRSVLESTGQPARIGD
jgi:6-phosphofructokinase 1